MQGSRPSLTFDLNVDGLGYLKLLKELFLDTFGTTPGHSKINPFIDRVIFCYYAYKRVRFANRDVLEELSVSVI
jgi:hypothetical protein